MSEEIQSVETTGALAADFAKAQAEMTNPSFDSQNPHFKNRFASLASVRNSVVPVLSKYGIAFIQDLRTTERGIECYTVLLHKSGEQKILGPLTMPASKPDAQGLGSAATYARRYSLMAIAGVVGDDDDDANGASGKPAPSVPVNKGIGKHSPLGDVQVDDRSIKYADAFRDALDSDDPENVKQVAADIKTEDGSQELYVAVWSMLDSKARTAIKKILNEKSPQ